MHVGRDEPICSAVSARTVSIPRAAVTVPTPRSTIPTATAGCSRKSPRDCPDASLAIRVSARRPISPQRSAARRPPMASTRSAMAANTTQTGRTGTPRTWWPNSLARSCRNRSDIRSLGSLTPGDRRNLLTFGIPPIYRLCNPISLNWSSITRLRAFWASRSPADATRYCRRDYRIACCFAAPHMSAIGTKQTSRHVRSNVGRHTAHWRTWRGDTIGRV